MVFELEEGPSPTGILYCLVEKVNSDQLRPLGVNIFTWVDLEVSDRVGPLFEEINNA